MAGLPHLHAAHRRDTLARCKPLKPPTMLPTRSRRCASFPPTTTLLNDLHKSAQVETPTTARWCFSRPSGYAPIFADLACQSCRSTCSIGKDI